MKRELWTVDLETEGIGQRPDYPPKPVGVAIRPPGRKGQYYSWGHPTKNNCSVETPQQILLDLLRSDCELLFHNSKFDLAVMEERMGLPLPAWDRVHDTVFELFLDDPYAKDLKLKPSSERLLGMEPEEQDAVREWLLAHKVIGKKSTNWGSHICEAPGDLVGKYAIGDVERTYKLHQLLMPKIRARGMMGAYDRERQLMPILMENEKGGIRADAKALARDIALYDAVVQKIDEWLRKRLKVKELNVDSDQQLAAALDHLGLVTQWTRTEKGQLSVSKENLLREHFKDSKVADVLSYRSKLGTCLSTFMKPWYAMAAEHGMVYTSWQQIKSERGGARTGRAGSSPNFQNVPKSFEVEDPGKNDYHYPEFLGIPPLPLMRRYLLPDHGQIWLHRDYSQQELRILAHLEDGQLMKAYQKDPTLDMHVHVGQLIHQATGRNFPRKIVKNLNFGAVYGLGAHGLAVKLGISDKEGRELKQAHQKALPGVKILDNGLKQATLNGGYIRTWGGRQYTVEDPRLIDSRLQTYEYKLCNYIIQGSAADCTKEAMIRYHQAKQDGRFLVFVHDEINLSCPKDSAKEEMKILRETMESVEFDVPMLTEGKWGKTWGDLKLYKDQR